MNDLYLILHKVRGEPTFDVAQRIHEGTPSDLGPWWIIPTSGHRAYPYWNCPLGELSMDGPEVYMINLASLKVPMPESLRDHYQVSTPTPTLARRTPKPAPATLDDLGDLLS